MTTSNRRVRVTAPARRDLREILQHSATTWGTRQRDAYSASIEAALRRLGTFPKLGRQRADLGEDVRGYTVEPHIVLYRLEGEVVTVLRVVHARRDLARLNLS